MAARKSNASSKLKESEKFSIPGIITSDLLELEELFPDLRMNLAYIMLPVLITGQIRVAHSATPVKEVQALESVNTYIRLFLAKSKPLLYICAAVAIRRTMVAYATSAEPDIIQADFSDLIENTKGKSSTRGGIAAALVSSERTRAFRRGIMLQVAGTIQATSLHAPRKLARDIETVNAETFLSRLPFETKDLSVADAYTWLNESLGSSDEPCVFVDTLRLPNDKVLLESMAHVKREYPNIPNVPSTTDLTKLPAWQRLAITQAQNLGGTKKV